MASHNRDAAARDGVVEIPPYCTDVAKLIAPASYIQDRFAPECEHIALPRRQVSHGVLRYRVEDGHADLHIARGRLQKVLSKRRARRVLSDKTIFDFRMRSPENWAHFLNNHLPIFFCLCDQLGLAWEDAVIVVPEDIPSYIHAAADIFGLTVLATDDVIAGTCIRFDADPWVGIRSIRRQWVHDPAIEAAIATATRSGAPLPRRVFLTRRDTRVLSNAAEVEAFLGRHDYVSICPEDLSVTDQFRLFRDVEHIVAIHGAGLAPLLYRPDTSVLNQLVEILPCGHMTDVYRVMAEQVGCAWIGVRGKMKPEYIRPAYDLGAGFSAFSLDDFEVDLQSLELALSIVSQHPKERPDV